MKLKPSYTLVARGYTLVEILVVLFIISIVTSVGLLSIRHNENKQMETFANELTQIMTLAEEQAMLQSVVLGLAVDQHSVQFIKLTTNLADKKTRWIPLDDTVLRQQTIPHPVHLEIKVPNQQTDAAAYPQIIISTNGDVTPFTIYIGKQGEKPRYAISGDANGNVINKALS